MEKKTIIILSFVSAIFSLIYILLNYFGYIRYLTLYMSSTEGYIKNYKNLDKINEDRRVVITIKTTPKQLQKISPVIRSLLDQTVKVDLISIVIPHSKKYVVPEDIKDAVSIFRHSGKYGGLISLIPTLRREGESTTQIITLNDSTIYGKDFIQELLENAQTYRSVDGTIIYNNLDDDLDVNKGVLFDTELFDETFFDVPNNMSTHDWLNNYLKKHKKINIKYSGNHKCF
jgi:hypothetical protein